MSDAEPVMIVPDSSFRNSYSSSSYYAVQKSMLDFLNCIFRTSTYEQFENIPWNPLFIIPKTTAHLFKAKKITNYRSKGAYCVGTLTSLSADHRWPLPPSPVEWGSETRVGQLAQGLNYRRFDLWTLFVKNIYFFPCLRWPSFLLVIFCGRDSAD